MINVLRKIKQKFFPKKLPAYVKLGNNAYVNPYSQIGCSTEVGEWTTIASPIIIKGGKEVQIGKYCAFGWGVRLQTSTHDMNFANMNNKFQKYLGFKSVIKEVEKGISIGNNVWIADDVIILPGVTVGDGAV
ncbi:MAG: hypothetical protein PHI38_10255, partial [Sulfurimonas sp.]|nr:hypothetical protein [Sulfurimonas sp.]